MRSNGTLSRRAVALVCAAVLLAGLVPLCVLAFYDHAFYDDLGYTLTTRRVWQETGSVWQTLLQGVRNAASTRNTWEGNYLATFLFSVQPALFREDLYPLTVFILLGALLAALLLFLRECLMKRLGAGRAELWTVFSVLAFLMIEFLPSPDEAFFWFNGGMAYTFPWSLGLLRLTLILSLDRAETRGGRVRRFLLLIPLTALCGGAKFSTLLYTLLLDVLLCVWAFVKKRPCRRMLAVLALILAAGFAVCATAPGNAVRALTLHSSVSAPKAVLQALYFGMALAGQWCTLPVLLGWAAAAALLTRYTRSAEFRFPLPALVTLLAAGLFCAQLAPTLVTGNYLGDGRTRDTYYYTYVLTGALLAMYWTGWAQHRCGASAAAEKESGIRITALLAAAVLLAVGVIGCRPEGAESWGPQNTASGSAVRSLLNGEAEAYHCLMTERERRLNDETEQAPALEPYTEHPALFMGDALLSDNAEYMCSLYAEYYGKSAVTIAGGN